MAGGRPGGAGGNRKVEATAGSVVAAGRRGEIAGKEEGDHPTAPGVSVQSSVARGEHPRTRLAALPQRLFDNGDTSFKKPAAPAVTAELTV